MHEVMAGYSVAQRWLGVLFKALFGVPLYAVYALQVTA